MISDLIMFLVQTVSALGYPGIVILMALESSFFPFPSEVVMVPAGYLAQQGEMDIFVVIIAGIAGSLIGAYVNYAIAMTVGRAALLRWGHRIFLPPEKLEKVEAFLRAHGEIGTFIGRLIPVVRQYISFPAGLSRMPIGRFSLYTALGAGLWSTILVGIGYVAGENEELISEWSHTAVFWLLVGCGAVVAVYAKLKR